MACAKPEFWPGPAEYAPNSVAATSTHFLSEDFCVVENQHWFVRCIMELPLVGAPSATFGFGVWASLSKKNFTSYVETFDRGEQGVLGPWFGWFANRLNGYPDTLNLKCQVYPQNGGRRPWIELGAREHPLAREAREGITFERLMEIYASYGHEVA